MRRLVHEGGKAQAPPCCPQRQRLYPPCDSLTRGWEGALELPYFCEEDGVTGACKICLGEVWNSTVHVEFPIHCLQTSQPQIWGKMKEMELSNRKILEEGGLMSLSPFLVEGGILPRSQEASSSIPRRKRTAGSRVWLQSLESEVFCDWVVDHNLSSELPNRRGHSWTSMCRCSLQHWKILNQKWDFQKWVFLHSSHTSVLLIWKWESLIMFDYLLERKQTGWYAKYHHTC